MTQISVKHDLNGLAAQLELMAKDKEAAAVRALNRTMTTVRADSARELEKELRGLGVGPIKRRIQFQRATRQALAAVLAFSAKRLRLFNWRIPQRRTPYGTGIRTSGRLPGTVLRVDAISGKVTEVSAAELRSAFVQRSRRFGAANIWLRQGKESVPIDVLVTPSLSEVLVQKKINQALARRARERFSVVFAQEAKFRLSRR